MKIIIESDVFSEDEGKRATIEAASKVFEEVVTVKHFIDVDETFASEHLTSTNFWRGSMGLKSKLKQHFGISEDDKKFNCLHFLPPFKKHALSDQYFFTDASSINELDEDFFPLFIRPVSGRKEFSGNVFKTKEKWLREFKFLTENKNHSPFTICLMAPERNVTKEFRFVFVNNRLVSGCLYLDKGERVDGPASQRAADLAKELAKNDFFTNFPDFVLDICESHGKMKFLEVNSIHTSSFYSCDLDKIYKAIRGSLNQ
jgi:hypothetical protein